MIREYLPPTLCERWKNGNDVIPYLGMEVQYKSLMSDFIELGNSLRRLGDEYAIVPVCDVFEENHTAYIVFTWVHAITFEEFLHRSGGELSWPQARKLFFPLFPPSNKRRFWSF